MDTQIMTPIIPGLPVTRETAEAARCRPVAERTQLPKPGDRVWYRSVAHGPLVLATVIEVLLHDQQDWNVWRFVVTDPAVGPDRDALGLPIMELVDDPWPDVILRVGTVGQQTREARIPGSPGWLPMGA